MFWIFNALIFSPHCIPFPLIHLQWKIGDPEPDSWFELYRSSPCVPVDYPSIPKALSIALDASPSRALRRHTTNCPRQVRSVRVLLRPGKYYLRQAVDVLAIQGVTVTLETMEMPKNIYRPVRRFAEIMEQALPLNNESPPSSPKRSPSFRNLFNCLRQENTETTDSDDTDLTDDWIEHNGLFSQPPKHATLILRSRRHNEPVFRIRQGVLNLNNLEVQHDSHGLDIWNGNAAVQIQPPLGEDELPIAVVPRPTAVLERVQISSKSGRGIVNIDGGQLTLRQCAVTNCAATGVYIGGQHSHATIEQSDVIRNGIGNRNTRRGIARGHSGIYLEQGAACIRHSNVSSNTLTGISVVSPDNATLTLEDSTLFSNGSYQLELPPPGTASRQRSVMNNNVLAERGELRLRSGLTLSEPIARPLPPPLPYHALQLQFAHPLPNY